MDRENAKPDATAIPGAAARRWVEHSREHAAPSEHSHDFVWDITREADGPFVTDVDGNVLLDFTCHIGAAPLGYNNEKILGKLRKFDLVDPLKIAGQDLYFGAGKDPADARFPSSSHLMATLAECSTQYGLDTVFLSNSGAEAVENAMKIAHNNRPAAKYGYSFSGSFHGRTLGTLSATNAKPVYTRHYPELAGIKTIPFCEKCDCAAETCSCGFFTGTGSVFRNTLAPEGGHIDPAEIAFVILEPIQGVGGYRFPSDAFMAEIGDVCETYDIPLIVDEIQSGVGRTGKMWASDHYPIEPDIIAAAKALRVGATVARHDMFPDEENRLGSTFGGGDILASMQGLFTLEAIDEYDLMANAVARGQQATATLPEHTTEKIVDVRGKGLMLAVEFDTGSRRDRVVKEALDRGMLTLGCGAKTLRLLPPLDVTEREIDLGTAILNDAIDAA
ncbi:class-III pyridoxal-phosphate-dependent aminotransferase [Halococcus salifodinae]|uniref:4-aminobutyrate aminotransferase n=1 Tax=Halococcus salifodinae DSM 8989 TaxID=1227456 RepID=M0N8L5_9EURY|nr:aminotransferase class III-fold pyridoxal phosphate-dependent enzyme [Halococcus salifodinae]EMA53439.1 4-aminobutyrate aminotransferase [Halococcus salifodinae DSM 8989]